MEAVYFTSPTKSVFLPPQTMTNPKTKEEEALPAIVVKAAVSLFKIFNGFSPAASSCKPTVDSIGEAWFISLIRSFQPHFCFVTCINFELRQFWYILLCHNSSVKVNLHRQVTEFDFNGGKLREIT